MSKNLITTLRAEHAQLFKALDRAKELGITTKEGQKHLLSIKAALTSHLAKEDQSLYPDLNKAALADVSLKKMLDLYAKEMESISQSTLQFFDKYKAGDSGLDFAVDCGRLYATLRQRMRKEEEVLYEAFDQL